MEEQNIDTGRIDAAILGLMFLTLHDADRISGTIRAWKSFDWAALGRLRDQGWIHNPVGKAKSVVLSPAGQERCEQLFRQLFCTPFKDPVS